MSAISANLVTQYPGSEAYPSIISASNQSLLFQGLWHSEFATRLRLCGFQEAWECSSLGRSEVSRRYNCWRRNCLNIASFWTARFLPLKMVLMMCDGQFQSENINFSIYFTIESRFSYSIS